MPVKEDTYQAEYNVCDICGGRVFVAVPEWKGVYIPVGHIAIAFN